MSPNILPSFSLSTCQQTLQKELMLDHNKGFLTPRVRIVSQSPLMDAKVCRMGSRSVVGRLICARISFKVFIAAALLF